MSGWARQEAEWDGGLTWSSLNMDPVLEVPPLDLADVLPTANPLDLSNVLRSDEPRPEFSQEQALSPAPERVDDLFAVPRID